MTDSVAHSLLELANGARLRCVFIQGVTEVDALITCASEYLHASSDGTPLGVGEAIGARDDFSKTLHGKVTTMSTNAWRRGLGCIEVGGGDSEPSQRLHGGITCRPQGGSRFAADGGPLRVRYFGLT